VCPHGSREKSKKDAMYCDACRAKEGLNPDDVKKHHSEMQIF
jgi:hypothetical protein